MSEEMRPKLGAGEWCNSPVKYSNVYSIQETTGPKRLLIGPKENHVDVMLKLAETCDCQFYLLYVLIVPRLGKREPGRYQSPGPLSLGEVQDFCRKFDEFLQGDARHHLWIGSVDNKNLLIYDRHEWIWAYGDLPKYESVLRDLGFIEGDVDLPCPHSHSYNAVFDSSEDEVFRYWEWKHFPLQEDDEN